MSGSHRVAYSSLAFLYVNSNSAISSATLDCRFSTCSRLSLTRSTRLQLFYSMLYLRVTTTYTVRLCYSLSGCMCCLSESPRFCLQIMHTETLSMMKAICEPQILRFPAFSPALSARLRQASDVGQPPPCPFIGRHATSTRVRMSREITERPDGVSTETPSDFASTSQNSEFPAVDDWGHPRSATPQPGSQEAIRRSAANANLELDDVWVQPQLYVTTRQFRGNKSFIGRLPTAAKNTLSVAGICHYLCVYRSERGELYQFDFGPFGGDVHSRLLSDTSGEPPAKSAKENPNATPGHVRERRLNAIPQEGTYLVGRTSMTLEDVRGFNATRETMYQVNKNDCRHYVNDLCLEGTGVQSVCSKYVRGEVFGKSILSPAALYAGEAASPEAKDLADAAEKERARRRKTRELAVLLPILAVSDLENVPVWDRLGQASTAALLVGVCVRALPAAAAALAASRAVVATGAGAAAARGVGAGVGAGVATVGAAAESAGVLVRAAAVTQPLVAPLTRRAITAAAGLAGGTGGDVARLARSSRDRAAHALDCFTSRFSRHRLSARRLSGAGAGSTPGSTRIGRAAAPATVMGWAGRKVTASATGGDRR